VAGGAVVGCVGWTAALLNTGFFGEEDGPLLWLGLIMVYGGSVVFVVGGVGLAANVTRALSRRFGAVTVALACVGVAVAAGAAYAARVDLFMWAMNNSPRGLDLAAASLPARCQRTARCRARQGRRGCAEALEGVLGRRGWRRARRDSRAARVLTSHASRRSWIAAHQRHRCRQAPAGRAGARRGA